MRIFFSRSPGLFSFSSLSSSWFDHPEKWLLLYALIREGSKKPKRKFLTLRLFFNPFLIPLPSLFNAFFIDLEKNKLCYKCTIHSPHPSQCELNNRSAGASFFVVLTMSVDLLRWVDSNSGDITLFDIFSSIILITTIEYSFLLSFDVLYDQRILRPLQTQPWQTGRRRSTFLKFSKTPVTSKGGRK